MQKLTFVDTVDTVKNSFVNCADFNSREILYCGNKNGVLFNIGSYTDRRYISDSIMLPLMHINTTPATAEDIFGVIGSSELSLLESADDAVQKLLLGFAVLVLELESGCGIFGCMVKLTSQRSINEPDTEVVVRGPREGFIENSEDNLALLRKRLKTPSFKALRMTAGRLTCSTVYVCYMDGIANSDTVKRISDCIQNMDLPSVMDSGYIEHYLKKSAPSLFPNVGVSEKPDVVAAKLIEGRVAVICEGSPAVLTAPYLFIEALQSAEDYLKTPFYASFIRILRFFSALISLYLPAVYLSTIEYHNSVLPYKLYKTVIEQRQNVPFNVTGELLVILLIFELIREVGIRMPRAVGDAVGIVAGLILGDAAISAGLAGAPVIMVASLTAVCTFITPSFMNSMVLIRFLNIFAAMIFGFPGVILSLCILVCAMCKKESFGVPYLMPFTPLKPKSLDDTLICNPRKALSHTDSSIYGKENN